MVYSSLIELKEGVIWTPRARLALGINVVEKADISGNKVLEILLGEEDRVVYGGSLWLEMSV